MALTTDDAVTLGRIMYRILTSDDIYIGEPIDDPRMPRRKRTLTIDGTLDGLTDDECETLRRIAEAR
jgi:hypothetical protein